MSINTFRRRKDYYFELSLEIAQLNSLEVATLRLLLTGDDVNQVNIWDVAQGTKLISVFGEVKPDNLNAWYSAKCVAFSPDELLILACNGCETIPVWNAQDGTKVTSLIGHIDAVDQAAFSPDGKYILSGSRDCTARLWDVSQI